MYTTPAMALKAWNLATDVFDYSQLEGNFAAIDQHNHAQGQGVQIPTGGIADGAITTSKLAAGAFTSAPFAAGVVRWNITKPAGNFTASDGQMIFANSGATITLPSVSPDIQVLVRAKVSVNGSNPVVVVCGGGANISGGGLNSATSFLLGTGGAYAYLVSDGSNWFVVGGQQDTGWVGLNMGTFNNVTSVSGSGIRDCYDPAARLQGDQVYIRGFIEISFTGSSSNLETFAQVPSFANPAHEVSWLANIGAQNFNPGGGNNNNDFFVIMPSGNMQAIVRNANVNPFALSLDGRNYTIVT